MVSTNHTSDCPTTESERPLSTREHAVRSILTKSGIRCTRPRLLIYETLCDSKAHPTAEELHQTVKQSAQGISLATIYNTLDLLVDNGLARRIANRCPGSGASRYDADQDQHIHLVLNDGTVLDAPKHLSKQLHDAIPQELMDELAKHAGVDALKIEIGQDSPSSTEHAHSH